MGWMIDILHLLSVWVLYVAGLGFSVLGLLLSFLFALSSVFGIPLGCLYLVGRYVLGPIARGLYRAWPRSVLPWVWVPADQVFVLERLGCFHKVLNSGLNWRVPFFDQVRHEFCTNEMRVTLPRAEVLLKSKGGLLRLGVEAFVFIAVAAPARVAYSMEDYRLTFQERSKENLWAILIDRFGGKGVPRIQQLEAELMSGLSGTAKALGLRVTKVRLAYRPVSSDEPVQAEHKGPRPAVKAGFQSPEAALTGLDVDEHILAQLQSEFDGFEPVRETPGV